MARTNTSGWLAGRVALAAATLVAGGAFVASTSNFTPAMAWADEAAQTEGAQDATVGAQISGSYWIASAQGTVESMQAARGEGAALTETQALDAQAQARAAQCAQDSIHSAQNGNECVAYLPAAEVSDPAADVQQMTSAWFTEGSALLDEANAYCGVALFQTQAGDLYLVAVFSNEAGSLADGAAYVQAGEGTGLQPDGTEVPVPATMSVSVPVSALTVVATATSGDEALDATGTYPAGTQLALSYTALDAGNPVTLTNASFASTDEGVAQVEGTTLTTLASGTANVDLYADGVYLASTTVTVADEGATADEPVDDATDEPANDANNPEQGGAAEPVAPDAPAEEVPAEDAATHTVSFDANGGSSEMPPVSVNANDEYTMPECAFTAPEGKVFDCWAWTDEEGTHTLAAGEAYGLLAGDVTFVAQWKDAPVTQYTVSFDANGGSGEMRALPVGAQDNIDAPECTFTAPEGKVFDSWNTAADNSGYYFAPGNAMGLRTSDITLYAQWKDAPVTQHTVSFDANGGAGTMDPVTVNVGDEYTLPECTFTAPEGKVFDCWGWNEEQGGLGTLPAGSDWGLVGADITLYAQWKDAEPQPVQQVTVTFDANGGTGTMDAITADLGTTVTLGTATFTREGYNFAGWNTAADGTGNAFVNGAQLTLGGNITLYAQWSTSKYITGVQNNLAVTTVAGTKPSLPATASIRWSDNTTSNEAVTWSEPANYAELYSKAGTFEVTGTVQGHTVKCTVTVTAAADNQQNGIAKTGDNTDNTPVFIAAGVGIVVVVLAVVLIIKSRKK